MPRLSLRLLLGAIALSLLADPAAAGSRTTMSKDEIGQQIIGNTLIGSYDGAPYAEYYAADGAIRGSVESGRYEGQWWLRDDHTMCFKYGEAVDGYWQGGCVLLSLEGDTVNFYRLDGSVEEPAKLLPGNPNGL